MPVQILIDENDTIDAIVSVEQASVEIIANVIREGDTIRLNGVHLERLSKGRLERQQISRLCAEVCRYFGANRIVVQGARRTTGRSAGNIPRPLEFRMPEQ